MKRQSEKYRLGILSELNITPLLDLSFVLLIIFVITSPFLAESADQRISTAVSQAESNAPATVTTISIDASRSLLLDGKAISMSDLGPILTARRQKSPDPEDFGVLVQAHRDLPVHELLGVMTQIKHAGVSKVSVIEQNPTVARATPK